MKNLHIEETRSIWDPSVLKVADAIAVPVNCKGVHGAGMAKEWADRYPGAAAQYRLSCSLSLLKPGSYLYLLDGGHAHLAVATKDNWQAPSKLEWIESALRAMELGLPQHQWKVLAMPALGCGLGKLVWEDVLPLVTKFASNCADRKIILFHKQHAS